MRSTDRPIVYTYTNSNYTNIFKEYKVKATLWNSSCTSMSDVTLYTGRTWFDSNHKTTILLSTILRDHTWRNSVVWDEGSQIYKPKNSGPTGYPIEKEPDTLFYTTTIKVIINGIQTASFKVTAQSYSELVTNTWNDPYTGTDNPKNNNPFNVLPHIPNINTNNIWLGLNYASWGVGTNMRIMHSGYSLSIAGITKGNYNINIPASTLNYTIGSHYLNDETVQLNVLAYNGSTPLGGFAAAVLDNCPKDYYLFWDNSYGFFSFGCDGKVYSSNNAEHSTMTSVIGTDRNLWNKNRYQWTVNLGIVNNDERAAVTTILDAQNVWLYDTKLDKTWNVKVNTSSLKNLPDNGKMDNVQIDLKEIIQHIY